MLAAGRGRLFNLRSGKRPFFVPRGALALLPSSPAGEVRAPRGLLALRGAAIPPRTPWLRGQFHFCSASRRPGSPGVRGPGGLRASARAAAEPGAAGLAGSCAPSRGHGAGGMTSPAGGCRAGRRPRGRGRLLGCLGAPGCSLPLGVRKEAARQEGTRGTRSPSSLHQTLLREPGLVQRLRSDEETTVQAGSTRGQEWCWASGRRCR